MKRIKLILFLYRNRQILRIGLVEEVLRMAGEIDRGTNTKWDNLENFNELKKKSREMRNLMDWV